MTLYYRAPDCDLYAGDALAVLQGLPDASVQCCVSSPPYWGLRDYGLPPSVWGGDPDCAHVWIEEMISTEVGKGNWAQGTNGRGEVQPGGVDAKREPMPSTSTRGYCERCKAWRGCLGLEPTPELFVAHIVAVFREVRRVLRNDGVAWVNFGDSYASESAKGGSGTPNGRNGRGEMYARAGLGGLKPKDLVGIPWRVAFALQADGWWLRSDIIWSKPNPMPESVTDRPTKAHEYLFLLTKSAKYFYDSEAIKEPANGWNGSVFGDGKSGDAKVYHRQTPHGDKQAAVGKRTYSGFNDRWDESEATNGAPATRNRRSVWEIATAPYAEAHFATFPPALVEPCILAGTSERGACSVCGAPWRRVVERETRPNWAPPRHEGDVYHRPDSGGGLANDRRATVETGWAPTCDHEAPTVPCVVLDPFVGSGTSALVARQLGRHSIGIDLNPAYLALAQRRLEGQALPLPLGSA